MTDPRDELSPDLRKYLEMYEAGASTKRYDMTDPRDELSPDLREYLEMYENGAASTLRGLRSGVIDKRKAGLMLIGIYNSLAGEIEQYGFDVTHPYSTFASHVLQTTTSLMGEEWVRYHT